MASVVEEDINIAGGKGLAGGNDWRKINYNYTEKQSGNEHIAFFHLKYTLHFEINISFAYSSFPLKPTLGIKPCLNIDMSSSLTSLNQLNTSSLV